MTNIELERVEKTYRRVGSRWAWNALSIAGFGGWESTLRRRTVEHLRLQLGDAVLDVACGRGSNFPHLEQAIGAEGHIVGVDYSPDMLAGAHDLVRRRGWSNIELVRADAATMDYSARFDGALCTIAMSVIPGWQETLRRMIAAVRPNKRIAIMDAKRSSEQVAFVRPFTSLFASVVAAEVDRDVQAECRGLLAELLEESRMFGLYFIMSGTARPDV